MPEHRKVVGRAYRAGDGAPHRITVHAPPSCAKRLYGLNTGQYAPYPMRDHQLGGSSVLGNLPLELNAFVGRSAELAGLAGVLGAARPVTVTGAGGVDKSRLAARARCGVLRVTG